VHWIACKFCWKRRSWSDLCYLCNACMNCRFADSSIGCRRCRANRLMDAGSASEARSVVVPKAAPPHLAQPMVAPTAAMAPPPPPYPPPWHVVHPPSQPPQAMAPPPPPYPPPWHVVHPPSQPPQATVVVKSPPAHPPAGHGRRTVVPAEPAIAERCCQCVIQ
jgi:hypothetical protein